MRHALFVYSQGIEDLDVLGFCCAIGCPETPTYAEAVEFLHPKLSSEDFVQELVEYDCLISDLFDGKPWKFVSCGWRNYCLEYEFLVNEEETVTFQKSVKFVKIV